MSSGWVYVMSNPAMPRLIKIGYTNFSPDERAKQLDTTGIPASFTVETAFLFAQKAILVERYAHELLDKVRKRNTREFFECSAKFAAENILEAARELGEEVLRIEPVLLTEAEKSLLKSRADQLIEERKKREFERAEEIRIFHEQKQIAEEERRRDELKRQNQIEEKKHDLAMAKMKNANTRGAIYLICTIACLVMSISSCKQAGDARNGQSQPHNNWARQQDIGQLNRNGIFWLCGSLVFAIGIWKETREFHKWKNS